MSMRFLALSFAAAVTLAGCQQDGGNGAAGNQANNSANAQGQASRTLADAVNQNGDLSQFMRAVQAAGLVETLRGAGPYTILAPSNAAFESVPEATRNRLMSPEGRQPLTQLVTYHMVPGVVTVEDLNSAIQAARGRATIVTVAGANLTVSREGDALIVTDAAGGRARVTQPDQIQSNGVIHQLDAVLMPQGGGGEAGSAAEPPAQ